MFEPVFKIRKPTCSSHDNYETSETESEDEDFFASLKSAEPPKPDYKFEDFFADITTTVVGEEKVEAEEEEEEEEVKKEEEKEKEPEIVVPIKTPVEKVPVPKRRRTVPKPTAVVLENE